MRHPVRVASVVLVSLVPALFGAGCLVTPPGPVSPSIYAGCWRFAVRMKAADQSRDFVDRDFTVEISPTGQVSRVLMRKEGENVGNPGDPSATFIELFSNTAAATLQNSFFAGRVGLDPTLPDVTSNANISATPTSFSPSVTMIITAGSITRYALSAVVTVDGDAITNVTGTFRDGAYPGGDLNIQQVFTGAGKIAGKIDCPTGVQACDRFFETNTVVSTTRFMAVDTAFGVAGQAIVASNATLQFFNLATSELRLSIGLSAAVQGRLAIDSTRRRLYAVTRNVNGNSSLVVIDVDLGATLRTVELKPDGCIDTGVRGSAAVIPSTGDVLVTIADANLSGNDGIVRVEPVSGQITGAIQNAHLTNAPVFSLPRDLVIFEANNVALVANSGALGGVVVVPLNQINLALRGGDTSPCRDIAPTTSLNRVATEGTGVRAIAQDLADSRGMVTLRGTSDTTLDGSFQRFTIAGTGAAAAVTFTAGSSLSRPTFLYGLEIDGSRNEAFVVNTDQPTVRISLANGAVLGTVPNIMSAGVSYVSPVVGRDRLLQAGNNVFFGEYCIP